MARFSDLRASSWHEMTLPRALLIPAVITIAADGSIDESEVVQLRNLIAFNPTFGDLNDKALDGITNSILDDMLIDGRAAVIAACVEALPKAMYETAFCFAVFVAMADGKLVEKEQDVLAEMAAAFNLRTEAVERISYVVTAMRRQIEN